jgi:hypothetical protein
MRQRAIITVVLLGLALLTGAATASSGAGPSNAASPTVSGSTVVGDELSASTGTWTGGVSSYTYQWQRCTTSTSCSDVAGATARTYGVRTVDVGDSLRVAVTAHDSSGNTSTAYSGQTANVTANANAGTTTVVRSNRPPTLAFLSLVRRGTLVYSRFRVCDDATARVKVTERDTKPGALAYTRHFAVGARPCVTYARHWGLAGRFRHGSYTATLQARDLQGATSPPRRRTLHFR